MGKIEFIFQRDISICCVCQEEEWEICFADAEMENAARRNGSLCGGKMQFSRPTWFGQEQIINGVAQGENVP